ncbi:hypothetical protein CPSG_02798 [Coccidioides posadasii str. Silveira]|uniref:Uncharacterized protein n=1 Tax=Coccidioides posadasii (strain RMSCC 757 / Silveira) TaxID=443226 RepID=E9CYC8_COCPS|nr:hypothetical protein CPSG_02798 [Coccidioides posadasii str. Silveira]
MALRRSHLLNQICWDNGTLSPPGGGDLAFWRIRWSTKIKTPGGEFGSCAPSTNPMAA